MEKFNLKNFIGAEKYYKNSVSIPIFHELTKKKQNYIINKINNFFKKMKLVLGTAQFGQKYGITNNHKIKFMKLKKSEKKYYNKKKLIF